MRFVIQNYNTVNKSFYLTPKFKNYLFLKNIQFFFLLYKNYYFFLHFDLNLKKELFIYFMLYRYFFFKIQLLLKKSFLPHLVGYYSNNLTKGFMFFYLIFWNQFLYESAAIQSLNFLRIRQFLQLTDTFLFNAIVFSHKTINSKTQKTFFNSLFFFLFAFSTTMWHSYSNFLKFYLNFVLMTQSLYLVPFVSGYFLPIYNN